ncbi:MAG: dephospho-CoA kinase [Geminicoccaceae bacterium]|nr:dephospho-CoA kinase [Geminicoccaceae bacterium]
MHVIGLTGSIAMGKSHVGRTFRRFGVPVFDSDAAVHALFAPSAALPRAIEAAFGGVIDAEGGVDRGKLGARVIGDPAALARLEALVHPAVRAAQHGFLALASRNRMAAVVLDVPLLFETDGARRCDLVAVVDAPRFLQRARALARPGMTKARLDAILAQQLPAADKRRRADVVIASGYDRGATVEAVAALLRRLPGWPAKAWPDRWLGD